jgi:hypothetical protein
VISEGRRKHDPLYQLTAEKDMQQQDFQKSKATLIVLLT